MHIRIEPDELHPAADALRRVAAGVAAATAALGGEVARCAPGLGGAASGAVQQSWADWSAALGRLGQAYTILGDALVEVAATYRSADNGAVRP